MPAGRGLLTTNGLSIVHPEHSADFSRTDRQGPSLLKSAVWHAVPALHRRPGTSCGSGFSLTIHAKLVTSA